MIKRPATIDAPGENRPHLATLTGAFGQISDIEVIPILNGLQRAPMRHPVGAMRATRRLVTNGACFGSSW